MSYAFTGQRAAHAPRLSLRGLRGLRSLGSCTPLNVKYANTPNGACRDNSTGSVVDCGVTACQTAASPAQAGPTPAPAPVFQNIPIPGFTGDFSVPTLDSALEQSLQAKESTFIANAIAKGSDSVAAEASDFQAQAQEHCSIYPSSDGCSNMAALVAQYVATYTAWAKSQSAQAYQGGDTGNLAAPAIPQTSAQVATALAPVIVAIQTPPSAPTPAPITAAQIAAALAAAPAAPTTQSSLPAAAIAPSVTLANLTNPGSTQFNIGDQWVIAVTGPPNTAVSVSATQNSIPLGTTPMGYTDGTGRLSLSNVVGDAQVGAWSETWIVGTQALAPITFNVSSASDIAAPVTDPALDSLQAAADGLLPTTTTATDTVDATTAWLTSNSLISALPNWLTVGGVGLIAYLAFFKDKGKQSK